MKSEPVAILALVAALVVSVAAKFGIVLETSTLETFVMDGVLIVTAILQRSKVSPAEGPVQVGQRPRGP